MSLWIPLLSFINSVSIPNLFRLHYVLMMLFQNGYFQIDQINHGFVLNVGRLCKRVFVSHTHVCRQQFTSRNGTVSYSSIYLNTLDSPSVTLHLYSSSLKWHKQECIWKDILLSSYYWAGIPCCLRSILERIVLSHCIWNVE